MTDAERRAKAQTKVAEVREKFLRKYSNNIDDDTYDDADVKWVKSCDAFICNVLCAHKTGGDIDKSVNLIDEVLKFRAKYKLSSLKESDLHQGILERKAMFFQGVDHAGRTLLMLLTLYGRLGRKRSNTFIFLRMGVADKHEFPRDEGKKFMAYVVNTHYMNNLESKLVVVFDCTGLKISNCDLDMARYVLALNDTYFPEGSEYALIYKLGKPLEVIWSIIKRFMSAEQTKRAIMVNQNNITDYIPEEHLLPHMKKVTK